MGKIKDALICGYYDEDYNYTVEIDAKKLKEVVEDEYKNFATNMETKIKIYDLIKCELTRDLSKPYKEFVVDLVGLE